MIRGLTTAASLWAVAAVGMAVGAGAWFVAVVATLIVVVSLWPLSIVVGRLIGRDHRRIRVRLSVADTTALTRLFEGIVRHETGIRRLGSERAPDGSHVVELEIRAVSMPAATAIMRGLEAVEGIDLAATTPIED